MPDSNAAELTPAELSYLRQLGSLRDGVVQRRAKRTRTIAGYLFVAAAFVVRLVTYEGSNWWWAILASFVAGVSAVLWMTARAVKFRAPVLVQVCDWHIVDSLLEANRKQ